MTRELDQNPNLPLAPVQPPPPPPGLERPSDARGGEFASAETSSGQGEPARDHSRALSPPARRRARRSQVARWVKRGALVLLAGAGLYAIASAWIPQPIAVDVDTVRRGALEVFVEEDGRTRVRDRYVVSAPSTGTLRRIEIEAGDRVKRGQVLAQLVPPAPLLLDARSRSELRAQLAGGLARQKQAKAALVRASAARDLAATMAARGRQLAPDSLPASELDRRLTDEQIATEDVAAAREQLEAAGADVRALRARLDAGGGENAAAGAIDVRAPASGRVLRVARESEGPIAAGAPLLELGDTGSIEVVIDVLSSDAASIEPGGAVWIDQWGGPQALRGSVTRVEPSAFTHISALGVEEQRVNVIVGLEDAPPGLGDGFRVDARILAWRGDPVAIAPASAVFRHGSSWAVYVAAAGRAELRAIEIGHRGQREVEILRGLDVGERIVLYPGDKLQDGSAIRAR